ncbi:sigma-70 family RNA polymerase sigma factor [Opitutales bacterium]|jgi:RNA polymerase sigma-70 factor, ECF subfamily|nr:sigma-70 family RNA polymerase sigma factor [Opitutales bacterium]MDA8806167.1 sigma-70 family RNA polymerase sigma factor [Opitutales bacterium]MDA8988957.1 sigma-70 family RNA polymerase sigma factor [Opitutales bacterium]MDA9118626.1 sigma-70 family RNA polymerase sigma factor [Opitutales bacterium]MDC0646120.1 sigma-70 family RNA polymerase sigma factor [Opitutales bacterium]
MQNNTPRFDPNPTVSQVLSGNKDAYRLIVSEYGLLVRGFLAARVYHLADAEDLAQDTFVKAYEKLEDYELGTNFRAWLMSIAQFLLNNHWRKNGNRATVMEKFRHDIAESIQAELKVAHEEVDESRIPKLLDCITKLPDNLRKVIRSGLDGEKISILAKQLNLQANAVYQLRHRAHIALRKCMNQTPSPTRS